MRYVIYSNEHDSSSHEITQEIYQYCTKKRIITEYPFLNYTIRTEQVHRDALTEKELEILEKYRENLAEPNEALNAFLFSCYTGLRYSDVRMFTKQNIYTINRKKWIVLKMYKTNKEIRIPLSTIFEGKR